MDPGCIPLLPILGCAIHDLHVRTRKNRGVKPADVWSVIIQLLGWGNIAGDRNTDDPASQQPDTKPACMANGSIAAGGWRRGGIPLGYQSIRVPYCPIIPSRTTYHFIYQVCTFPDRIPSRVRCDRLWNHGCLPGSPLSQSSGSQR